MRSEYDVFVLLANSYRMAMLVLEFMDCTLYEFIHSKKPVDFSYKIRLAQGIKTGLVPHIYYIEAAKI